MISLFKHYRRNAVPLLARADFCLLITARKLEYDLNCGTIYTPFLDLSILLRRIRVKVWIESKL